MALSQGNYQGDWLLHEFGAPNHCRKEVTIKSGENLVSGQVVALDAGGDGSWVAFEDDTDTPAAGILLTDCNATGGAKTATIIVRGPVTVSKGGLTWATNNDATDITNGLADLLALGIVAVEGV